MMCDRSKERERCIKAMAVFIGHFLLTSELLNKMAAPLLKRKYRYLEELSFRIVDDFVIAEIAGRYHLLGFAGSVALHLLEFLFGSSGYRIELRLSAEIRPRLMKPVLMSLIRKEVARLPGVSWSGKGIRLELVEMPLFLQIREAPPWNSIVSGLEVVREEKESRGLLFTLYLNDPPLV